MTVLAVPGSPAAAATTPAGPAEEATAATEAGPAAGATASSEAGANAAPVTGGPLWFFVNLARVRIGSADSGGTIGVVELTGRQAEMPPLHVHRREDETFVVIDGELTLFTPGASRTLRAGKALLAPKGVPHAYRVESERARWLAVSTPAGFADFVLAASVPAEADELPPADRPLDMPALLAAAEAHGIAILGPPGLLP